MAIVLNERILVTQSIKAYTKQSSMHISNCLICICGWLAVIVDDCFVFDFFFWILPFLLLFICVLAFFLPSFRFFFVVKLTFYCWYCTIMLIVYKSLCMYFLIDFVWPKTEKDWLQQRVFVINKRISWSWSGNERKNVIHTHAHVHLKRAQDFNGTQ